ncbi:MAG: ABC transporter substrate-binding protein [Deltaproteobacteria bacterium]|nr:ABC transporter substrate-binding protein [Deltaproteobacteria bacterium]
MHLLNKISLICLSIALVIPSTGLAHLQPHSNSAPSDELVLGMSTALSGPTAELGRRMRAGVQLAIERYNSDRNHTHKIRLAVYDDGYEPYRVAANMNRLIDEDNSIAIIGNVGTPTAIAALPIITEKKILFFAPFSGAGLLRKTPPEHYVINYRASYSQEISAMIDALINYGGLKTDQIAFFTQRDGYGDAGYVSGFAALKRHGLKDSRKIVHVRYERNTLAVENALADILLSAQDIKAIVMVGAYAPCAKFIRLAKQSGLKAVFLNVSFASSDLLLRKLGKDSSGVLVTQVVPPLTEHGAPIVQQYLADLRNITPEIGANYVGLEGYIGARLLLRAIDNIQGQITRERVIGALEDLGTFDLGVGVTLSLNPLQHQASHQVWVTQLQQEKTSPYEWQQIKALLQRETSP